MSSSFVEMHTLRLRALAIGIRGSRVQMICGPMLALVGIHDHDDVAMVFFLWLIWQFFCFGIMVVLYIVSRDCSIVRCL